MLLAAGGGPGPAEAGTVPEVKVGLGPLTQPDGLFRKQRLRPSFRPHVKAPQPG